MLFGRVCQASTELVNCVLISMVYTMEGDSTDNETWIWIIDLNGYSELIQSRLTSEQAASSHRR